MRDATTRENPSTGVGRFSGQMGAPRDVSEGASRRWGDDGMLDNASNIGEAAAPRCRLCRYEIRRGTPTNRRSSKSNDTPYINQTPEEPTL